MSRPTLYTPELLEKAKQYLIIWNDLGDTVPSVEGFADYLEVSRSTVYDWATKTNEDKSLVNPEFSDILELIMTKQGRTLINGSLKGVLNSNISKLMLTKHNYSDKQETDVTSGGEKLQVNVISFDANSNNTSQS